jgi:hypothetical protein
MDEMYYIVTMRLFNDGRINAFIKNNDVIQYDKSSFYTSKNRKTICSL